MTGVAVAANAAGERFAVEFQVADGSWQREPLSSCHGTRFEEALPARPFRFEKGLQSFAGWWYFATTGTHVGFESWLERDHLMLTDFDPAVRAVASQPFWLHWRDEDDRARRHAPDFFARRNDGSAVVVDVRPDHRIPDRDAQTFAVTAQACEAAGWEYRRSGDLDPVLVANVRWLSRYRHRRCLVPDVAAVLLEAFAGGRGLFEGAELAGDRLRVLPVLFHLMWQRQLAADLTIPLGMATVVDTGGIGVSGARRRQVGIGDRILVGGRPNVVISIAGTRVRMAGEDGTVTTATVAELVSSPGFEFPAAAPSRETRPGIGLEGLPAAAVEEASWWEAHIAEVVYGLRPDAPAGARPRPQYDPERTSLTGRERTKAAELSAAGRPVPPSTVKHRRQRWEAHGLAGLVDRRSARRTRPAGRADERVVEAMRQAIGEARDASSRTTGHVIWRTKEILAEAGYDGAVPSDRTFYRLFGSLSNGRHVTGSASTRRSLAGRPEGTFGSLAVAAPGEVVQIDSTPLDVLVLLDDGVPGRVEMTGMIDVATRVVPAAVLRPTTKSVDASVLLARALTPEPVRPGWPEALRMARSALPYKRLLAIDERLEHAAARPVIVPDTIVIDHGSVFVSAAFRSACRHLGISIQPAHLGSGAEKGHIERHFGTVASLFSQFASGYAGRSPDRRGRHVQDQPLWSMAELQELLDEWLLLWLNRPHDGLRDPEHPGRAFTPNEKYAALVETAGYVPVALGPDDYVELLPAEWRAVNAYGIKLNWRTYDREDGGLDQLRLAPPGVKERRNLWEIRHDPYDVSRIHVRGPGGWITAFWKHLNRVPMPFGELAWDHARRGLGRGADEEEIADAVAALLRRASNGPEEHGKSALSRRDRRVAARTKAASPAEAGPADQPQPGTHEPEAGAGQAEEDAPLAKVIPMPIFDPFAEADKPW